MLTVAGCKLGQNLLRDQADPSAIGGLSSAEFLTTSCVFRSLEFRDFLKKALDKNPETRPSAAQLLEVGTRAVSPGWFQIISVLFRKFFSEEKSAFQHFSATEMLQKGSAMFFFFSLWSDLQSHQEQRNRSSSCCLQTPMCSQLGLCLVSPD